MRKITKEHRAKMQAGHKKADFCYKCKYYMHPMKYVDGKLVWDEDRINEKPERNQSGWWCNNPKSKFYNYQVDGNEKYACCEKRG